MTISIEDTYLAVKAGEKIQRFGLVFEQAFSNITNECCVDSPTFETHVGKYFMTDEIRAKFQDIKQSLMTEIRNFMTDNPDYTREAIIALARTL